MSNFILSEHAKKVITERKIDVKWIDQACRKPDHVDNDKKSINLEHRLKIITDYDNRVLRVVCNVESDPITIVTAFFDRRMKGELK
ncbi:MAG TPA: DUF4258 domain-containing protein [Ignavibacteria bacterium]|nr:DUF4258 domain-containing protein [Ignavibacteria bacterium]